MSLTVVAAMSSLPLARLDDLMVEFLEHFMNGLHQLFNGCVSLILAGQDSYNLGCPMLLSYVEKIERISSPNQASFY